jgi:predicted amidohydrolase YtcJ
VAFSRVDGHALWFNSMAESLVIKSLSLKESQEWKMAQTNGLITNGIAIEGVRKFFWRLIPSWNHNDLTHFALKAQDIFLKNGFTHVRDMEGTIERLQILLDLEVKQKWNLNSIINLELSNFSDLKNTIQQLQKAKTLTANSQKIRIQGLKFYVDGALGSEGALISHQYIKTKDQTKSHSAQNGIQVLRINKFIR